MTAFKTPASFGEEPMSERKQKCLQYLYPMVFFLNLLAPVPFWIAYVIGQINLENKNFFENTGHLLEWYKKYYFIVAPYIVLL
jgi:hypothetical protein